MRNSQFVLMAFAWMAAAPSVSAFSTAIAGARSVARTGSSLLAVPIDRQASRRSAFGAVVSAAAAGTFLATPLPAFADVTSKVASSAALRSVKKSLRELEDMGLPVATNDYEGVRSALRVPPFTEVRRNMSVLIKGGEDGPEAEKLRLTYAEFILRLEALDSAAGLGMRGRKGVEMQGSYDATVTSLGAFVQVAEEASAIPVQYND